MRNIYPVASIVGSTDKVALRANDPVGYAFVVRSEAMELARQEAVRRALASLKSPFKPLQPPSLKK